MTALTAVDPERVAERLAVVRDRISTAGGDPALVRVVAVTKGFGADAVQAALACGLTDVGESYAQELMTKAVSLTEAAGARWHFIGRLQSNKIRRLAPLVHLWQSVDRTGLVDEIARRSPGAAVLLQVNISGEEAKGGCSASDVGRLAAHASERGLDVRGLMGMAAEGDLPAARRAFARLAALADELELPELSMGMSSDLEQAVAEGATMVRVGTDLFGPRSPG
jgi:pyridoxal phosphate enzyme (YggS family)